MIVGLVGCSAIISRNVPNHSLQEITIPTAQCGMCVARIDKALTDVDGILKYKVELDALKVKVKYDNNKISLQQIEQIISKTGATAVKDMGKVMGILKPQLQGKADMGEVSKQIKARLS